MSDFKEGNLFAGVLKKKREDPVPQQQQEDPPVGRSSAISATKVNMFAKKREPATNRQTMNAAEESKKDETSAAKNFATASASKRTSSAVNMFAQKTTERGSVLSKKQRNLSHGFLNMVGSNTLKEKAAASQADADSPDKEDERARGRGSIASHIAMFQANIDQQSARSKDNQVQLKKQNIFKSNTSELSGRNSVKDLVLQFNSNIRTQEDEQEPQQNQQVTGLKLDSKRITRQEQAERASIGNAFLRQVTTRQKRRDDKQLQHQRGQSVGGDLNSGAISDGRMSLGDHYLQAVKKDGQDERKTSQEPSGSKGRSPNIFNKVRAMQASQKFSVRSEGGHGQSNMFALVKQTGEGIVDRDDGGNLVSADQFAKNLVASLPSAGEKKQRRSTKPRKQEMAAERNASADDNMKTPLKFVGGTNKDSSGKQDVNDTGMLQNLDEVQSPHSPDQKQQRGDTNGIIVFADKAEKYATSKPLDLRNQIRDLTGEAQVQRYESSERALSSQRKRNVTVKKLGTLKDKELSQTRTDRSKLTADIIVVQQIGPEANKNSQSKKESEEVKLAPVAAERSYQPAKSREESAHEDIGRRMAAIQREHESAEREYKLEYDKPSARKISRQEFAGAPRKQQLHRKTTANDEFALADTTIKSTQRVDRNQKNSSFLNKTREVETERTQEVQGLDKSGFDQSREINVMSLGHRKRNSQGSNRGSNKGSNRGSYKGSNKGSHRGSRSRFASPDESYSSQRNANFVQYVVGGDTLLPKRVRSRKSDLPYSDEGSSKRISVDAAEILQLQEQIGEAPDQDVGAAEKSEASRDQAQASFSDADEGAEDEICEFDNQEQENQRERSEDDCNAEEDTPTEYDEDDEALDEIERRIAEQEKVINDFVDDKAQTSKSQNNSGFAASAVPYQTAMTNGLANFLDSSNEGSQILNEKKNRTQKQQLQNSNHLDQLRHEIELEELQKAEQLKLEQAIQQAYDQKSIHDQTFPSQLNTSMQDLKKEGTRSQLASFNDMSNIQRNHDSSQDISVMQQKIDAIEDATSTEKQPANMKYQSHYSGAIRVSGQGRGLVTPLAEVSDITDPSALRRNYLEKSANDVSQEQSVDAANNQREEQLKRELAILELELELQMNEEELMSDQEAEDSYIANQQRVSQMTQEARNQQAVLNNGDSSIREVNSQREKHAARSAIKSRKSKQAESVTVASFSAVPSSQNRSAQSQLRHHEPRDGGGTSTALSHFQARKMPSEIPPDLSHRRPQQAAQSEKPIVPVSLDDQEVLCSNCYETIPMSSVDQHSTTCFKDEPAFRPSQLHEGKRTSVTIDEEQEFLQKSEELNERIFKLIQTFLRKLDSQLYLDQIYTTQGNDDMDNSSAAMTTSQLHERGPWGEDERGGKKSSTGQGSLNFTPPKGHQPLRSATALAEERTLIHEVVQHANLALQGLLNELQAAAEQLEQLEEEHDLNQKFEFNNHMVFNRIVQVVNIKLEVMQEWEQKVNPDATVPYTKKQLRQMHEQHQKSYRIEELNVANLNMLPSGPLKSSEAHSTRNSQHKRMHSQERQLHDFIQATKAQAMQQRKKKANIFTSKQRGNSMAESATENWVLSDMGSDNVSMGGDSHSSYSSMHRPKFQAQAALKKHNKQ